MKRLIPSTGKTVDVGDPGLNRRGFQPGERILYRKSLGAWTVDTIERIHEAGLVVTGSPAGCVDLSFRDVAGKVPETVDADALVERLRAIDRHGLASISVAREVWHEKLLTEMEGGELERVAPFVPGM